jgi:hypothetical protein
VAKVVVDAIATKPVGVVFPVLAGRVQRLAGTLPLLIRWLMPLVEARGRRQRERLIRTESVGLSTVAGRTE